MSKPLHKEPSLLDAVIPVGFLVTLLFGSVYLYGADSSYGANQIALIFSGGVALLIGWKNGHRWIDIEEAIAGGIAKTFGAMLILLTVGALIGSWILAGIVPAMIYYGLQFINPDIFYFTACLLCALTAISIGSSWSAAGTVGIGLMGVSAGLGLSLEITAGAIISGAYFGDKMSPLSDTTNLAPAIAGGDLFSHIRHMAWTTIPAITLALILYAILGFTADVDVTTINLNERLAQIDQAFNIGPHLMIPLVVVLALAIKGYPPFPTLFFGALLGAVFALLFQQDTILTFVNNAEAGEVRNLIDGVWRSLFGGYQSSTGNAEVDALLSRGGMASMLNTIWLIICAIVFGSIMEHLGLLKRLVVGLIGLAKTQGSLILLTACTCIGVNIIAADQYISIVLPGRMYRIEFRNRGLASKNLSRVLEDAGTVTSVLIPWNTCGAFMAGTLGVATFDYAMFCFFNLASPFFSVLYGYLNFKITPVEAEEAAPA